MLLQCAAIIDYAGFTYAGVTVGEFVAQAEIVSGRLCLPTDAAD